jgi:hypothetical protein
MVQSAFKGIATRSVFPGNVENQRVSVICTGGDPTFRRIVEPITDKQPNIPSATFLLRGGGLTPEAEFSIDSVYSVREMNQTSYRDEFNYTDVLIPRIRGMYVIV